MTAIQTTATATGSRHRQLADVATVASGDAGWDAARQAFNLTLDQRPALIAFPEDAEQVASVIRFARESGLTVAAQRTGHNADPLGSLAGAVLLRTDRMQGVEIDPDAARARVLAGAKWENLVPDASELGLAALHGSTPDVGIVGYSLGGGVGWYARKHGLSANSVTAIELVTADGRLRRVDPEHEPELFWALRGGGGSFGVVTAIEFRLYRIAHVYAGTLFFPWERSSEVLHAWREWLPAVPEEVTSVGRIMQFPPLPEVPEPLRGNSYALVQAVYLGDEAEGAELLRPLRKLGPVLDTFATIPPVGIAELAMDPPEPLPYVSDHQLLGDLPSTAIDALIDAAGPDSGSPLISVEVRHAAGALARSEPSHGALDTLPGSFVMFAVGLAADPASTAAVKAQLQRVTQALAPHDVGRYLNFTPQPVDPGRFFPEDTHQRLQAVKTHYDPQGLFQANHPIAKTP